MFQGRVLAVRRSLRHFYLIIDEKLQMRMVDRENKVEEEVELPTSFILPRSLLVYRNKKDKRGVIVRNKARLVAQGYTQEKGIDYDKVFAPVARIEAIRLFLAYVSFIGLIVYQMDVKSAFLYGTIEEEVYVCQPHSFEDPQFPDKVYKIEKALYSLHQAPKAWYETLSTDLLENGFRRCTIDKTLFIKKDRSDILLVQVYVDDIIFGSTKKSLCVEFEQMMHKRFQMSSMGELTFFLGLQVQQKEDGIFISQDKYVADILKKFDFVTVKTASTPMEPNKALVKDEEAEDVDVHLYRSMIGSLMYLTASRPDITFVVCACARFQVTPKISHLHAVKRIFRYLKGQPKLGLWYPMDSPFDLEAFSDSDYAGASLDRKSTTGGCQFLGKRLISWQCKKQTIVANSTTEVEYVVAANCCGQVLWIQNQMLDYGFNFMNTKIHIDNESTICIVKNLVFHSKTKHIEIRHHFIRDSYEKKLIQVIKIHTDHNVADLLTKAFDVSRSDLKLDDAEGTYCLPTATIFAELERMGAKTTSWNEFSSTKASAIICLATNQKFNLSKYIFDNMVKNLDGGEIAKLKKRIKSWKREKKVRTLGLKRLKEDGSLAGEVVAEQDGVVLKRMLELLLDPVTTTGEKKDQIALDAELAPVAWLKTNSMMEADEQLAVRRQLKNKNYGSIEESQECIHNQSERGRSYEEIQEASLTKQTNRSKKQKIDKHVEAKKDDDQEEAEMKRHIEIVKDDEIQKMNIKFSGGLLGFKEFLELLLLRTPLVYKEDVLRHNRQWIGKFSEQCFGKAFPCVKLGIIDLENQIKYSTFRSRINAVWSRVLRTSGTTPNETSTLPFKPVSLKPAQSMLASIKDRFEEMKQQRRTQKSLPAKTEGWAMPTWCHMFNSTLTGNARVWFDKLPKESIDSYEDLRTAFRENYLQQTKHIKDPVEIHHIKQRDGESTEDFMERYKAEVLDVEGAPECMRISGFMHGITHPGLIKRLYERIPRSMDEMYRMTTLENCRNHAKKLKQNDKPKAPKRGEASGKDKPLTILMIQPWEMRCAKPRITRKLLSGDSNVFSTPKGRRRDGGPNDHRSRNGRHLFKGIRDTSMGMLKFPVKGGTEGIFLGYKVSTNGLESMSDKADAVLIFPSRDASRRGEKRKMENSIKQNSLSNQQKNRYRISNLKIAQKRAIFNDTEAKAFQTNKNLFQKTPNTYRCRERELTHKSYTLAHQKKPISALFQSSEISGRMLKWKFELEGYDIQYRPRTAIKGQILADFIVERPEEESPDELMAEPEVLPEPWTLFTDGSSCVDGSGAGLILTNPEGAEFTYAMRFRFEATNNEAEYEALIAGLRIAEKMGIKNLQANVDSRLVANQVNGSYIAKESGMVQYLNKVKTLAKSFKEFSIKQIPRSENKKADALSKIASTSFAHLNKQVLVEELKEKSINEEEILDIVEKEGQSGPWLRCVGPLQANYVLREIHEGSCSMHSGPRSVVAKVIQTGYYWPTMHMDARNLIRECNDCQIHRPVPRNPQQNLTPITSPWPFYKWGIDIAGPFPEGPGKVKFLIVAIDYFTKWIEAKAVATITGSQVKKFVWDNIVCRFGLPGEIISDNGKQFRDNPFKDWCEKLCIRQCFASVKHPQANGLVERANRSLGEGIKARLDERSRDWIEELPHVLWAHRTMIKSSNGETPFSLTYGTEAVIPAEIGMPTLRTAEIDQAKNNEALGINLDLIEERREQAAIQEAKSKKKMEKYYNSRVRGTSFKPGEMVYRSNEASHAKDGGKLGPKWEGPYEVKESLGKGAYKLKDRKGNDMPRTWNICNLKKCYIHEM
ncbi:reverse transcriptase domain-containing protein [Tanacetum coccineum]